MRSPAAEPCSAPRRAAQRGRPGKGRGAAAPWGALTVAGGGGCVVARRVTGREGETCPRFPLCTGALSPSSGLHNGAGCARPRGSWA